MSHTTQLVGDRLTYFLWGPPPSPGRSLLGTASPSRSPAPAFACGGAFLLVRGPYLIPFLATTSRCLGSLLAYRGASDSHDSLHQPPYLGYWGS